MFPSRRHRISIALLVVAATSAAAIPALADTRAPASASDASERLRSRTAHANLSPDQALTLGRATAPALLGPPIRLHGGRATTFLNDHVARVGTGSIVDSTVPLRTDDGDPVDLGLRDAGGAFVPASPLAGVRIAKAAAGGATLTSTGVALVPIGAANTAGRITGGAVFWPEAFTDSDLTTRPTLDGFESSALIRSAAAPETYRFRVALPDGASARERGGAVVVAADGGRIATISPAIAYDADGKPVHVDQRLAGNVLELRLAHRDAAVRYPLVLDPTVTDNFNWGGGESSYAGWESATHPGARFATGCRAGACGIHIYDTTGVYSYPDADVPHWRYAAPNWPEVQITGFNASGHLSYSGNQMCVRYGLSMPGYWSAQDFECGVGPKSATLNASEGRYAYFQAYMWFGGPRVFEARTTSAAVTLTDGKAPATVSTNAPSGWTNSAGASISATFDDAGLGIQSARLHAPTFTSWTGGQTYNASCARVTCPARATLNGSVANLPNGATTVDAAATDRAGNVKTESRVVKVDRANPSHTVTGTGWEPAGGALAPGEHTISVSASDPHAGVQNITIRIDGKPVKSASNSGGGCDGCSLGTSYTFDTSDYPPMEHEITVTTTDYAGNARTSSSRSTWGDPVRAIAPSACTATATTIAGGYVSGSYSSVRTEAADARTTRLCYHVAAGTTNQAGVLEIQTGTPSVALPSVDANPGACTAPAVFSNTNAAGTVTIDYEVLPDAVWLCLRAPGQNLRVVVPVEVSGLPAVRAGALTPPPPPPPPTAWPAKASNACVSSGGQLVAQYSALGTGVWLAHRTSLGQVQVCVRAQNASGSGAGGVITIDPDNVTGVVPQVGLSSDTSPCHPGVVINHLDEPVKLWLDASSPGSNPQSICIEAEGGLVHQRIYVRTGSAGAPVTYTPDA